MGRGRPGPAVPLAGRLRGPARRRRGHRGGVRAAPGAARDGAVAELPRRRRARRRRPISPVWSAAPWRSGGSGCCWPGGARWRSGVAEGDRLVASKVDSYYVQGRTAAGGWSQQRFARRRENQATGGGRRGRRPGRPRAAAGGRQPGRAGHRRRPARRRRRPRRPPPRAARRAARAAPARRPEPRRAVLGRGGTPRPAAVTASGCSDPGVSGSAVSSANVLHARPSPLLEAPVEPLLALGGGAVGELRLVDRAAGPSAGSRRRRPPRRPRRACWMSCWVMRVKSGRPPASVVSAACLVQTPA